MSEWLADWWPVLLFCGLMGAMFVCEFISDVDDDGFYP